MTNVRTLTEGEKISILKMLHKLWETERQINYCRDKLLSITNYLCQHVETLTENEEIIKFFNLNINKMKDIVKEYKEVVENFERVVNKK